MHRGILATLLSAFAASAMAADVTVDVRDAGGHSVVEAVLYAQPASGPSPAAPAGSRAVIDQVNKEFVPRVSIVQAGTEVQFPNSDNIRHSIYSFSPAKTFTTKLYAGRGAAPVLFDQTGVVVLGCNIHDKMVAWVVVVDTPWIARTGTDGSATLKGLPPGDYRVTATAPAANLGPVTADVHVDAAPLRHAITLSGS